MADVPVRILQISDLHLQKHPTELLYGVNVEQRFQRVLVELQRQTADLLLLTGDLSHHAGAAYQRISDGLQTLAYPAFWIPGNHDLPGEMMKFAEYGYGQKVIDKGRWKIIMLDSTAKPDGRGSGALSEPELEFLRTELDETELDRFVLLVLHHNPVSVDSEWQDAIGLANRQQLWSVLEHYPQVRGAVFGHVHQALELWHGKVQLFSVPAIAPQFKAKCDDFTLEDDPELVGPAFASYVLQANGQISVRVDRLSSD